MYNIDTMDINYQGAKALVNGMTMHIARDMAACRTQLNKIRRKLCDVDGRGDMSHLLHAIDLNTYKIKQHVRFLKSKNYAAFTENEVNPEHLLGTIEGYMYIHWLFTFANPDKIKNIE